jgi:hypothetical protein
MIEISIVARNEEKKLQHKHLAYNTDITLNKEDQTLVDLLNSIQKEFGEGLDDITVKIKFIW